jgi:hypothetical protein
MRFKLVLFIFVALSSIACSINYEKANAAAFEKLHRQIKAERFD